MLDFPKSAILACFALLSIGVGHSDATPILDQFFVADVAGDNTIIAARFNAAQTFTVGITGVLTSVEVNIAQFELTSAPLVLDIRTTTDGVPTEPDSGSNVLATLTLPAASIPSIPEFVTFDVPDLSVTAGEVLAITMSTTAGAVLGAPDDAPFIWLDGSGYSGGRAFARGVDAAGLTWGDGATFSLAGTDYAFRTFVDPASPVPEPSTLLLLCVLAVSVGTLRNRANPTLASRRNLKAEVRRAPPVGRSWAIRSGGIFNRNYGKISTGVDKSRYSGCNGAGLAALSDH